jgi:transposase
VLGSGEWSPERSGGGHSPSEKYDGEVKPTRRRFPMAYKVKILSEIDKVEETGGIGLILRREGLYSSQVYKWRQAMKATPKQKKRTDDLRNENAKLKRDNIRLKAKLEKSEKLIELQKKMAEFAQSLSEENSDESPSI